MVKNSLEFLFNPESIAIIGASPNAASITGQPLRHLLDRKYRGRIYPVNAKYGEIAGFKCYGSVGDLPEAVDLAVIVIKAVSVPDVLMECGKRGIKAAIVISGGFAEAGETGRALQEKVKGVCRNYGIRVVGPNSQGMLNLGDNVCAGFGPVLGLEYGVEPGALSFVIVERLNHAINAAAKDPATRARLDDMGVEVVDDSTPDSLRNFVPDEIAKWSKVFKEAGIKPD